MSFTYLAQDAYAAAQQTRIEKQNKHLQRMKATIDESIVTAVNNGELNMELAYRKDLDITDIRRELHEAGFKTSIKNWSQDVNQLVVSWSHIEEELNNVSL